MLNLIQRLDALPIRSRFLIVPLISLGVLGLLLLLFTREAHRQDAVLRHAVGERMPVLDAYTEALNILSGQHTDLIALLHDARARSASEGELQDRAAGLLETMHLTAGWLNQTFAAAQIDREQGGADHSAELEARRRRLAEQSATYFKAAGTAVELSTVNLNAASYELVAANSSFIVANQQLIATLDLMRQDFTAEIRESTATHQVRMTWLGVAALLVGLLSVVMTVWMTRRLSRVLESHVAALVQLGHEAGLSIVPGAGKSEVGHMGAAIAAFRDTSARLKQNERLLTEANDELRQARDLLERRVAERTGELVSANAELSREVERRQEAEQRLRIYAEVIKSTSEGIVISAIDHTVIDANRAYLAATGYAWDEVVGGKLLEHAMQPDSAALAGDWRAELEQHGGWTGELLLNRKDGESIPCLAYINRVEEEDSGAQHLVGICHDISELRRHEVQLEFQATHDSLTSLPNRALLLDRLNWAISRATRDAVRLAMMFIDLDKFKFINDTLGHAAGDQLLITMAERLSNCVRECDTTARLGGDEFVILVEQVEAESGVSRLAERIIETLAAPVQLLGEAHVLTCSVGISFYPEDGTEPEILLKNADIAMYRAKESGRNNFQFFKPEMQVRLGERISLERQLHRALDREEFLLHYQPQVDLRTGAIIGMEALIRWQSPELGLVSPARFIPVAEESNLIHGIGEWVLGQTCRSIQAWQRQGHVAVPVAVNVAASQFAHQRIDTLAQRALQATGIDPQFLELELTESLSMVDPDTSVALMHRLKDIGVSLSIDDFGTGYSNLGYLKRFPVDKLKIDQSFVRGLTSGSEELAISSAVIGLSHALGLRVIAEGVETASQLQLLAMLGCDEMQGYYFSRPVPEADATALLAEKALLDLDKVKRAPYRRTVLIVDDDPYIRASIQRLLQGEGLELLTAANTEQAYEVLAGHEVGVVISDYQMPGGDGIAFLSCVKKMYPRSVRILLTGHGSTELISRAINKGEIFRFVSKPWAPAEIQEALREAFQRYEA